MQKTRRLMDETSISFQMFLILLSFLILHLVQKAKVSVFEQCQSNSQMFGGFFFLRGGSMLRSQNLEKKTAYGTSPG